MPNYDVTARLEFKGAKKAKTEFDAMAHSADMVTKALAEQKREWAQVEKGARRARAEAAKQKRQAQQAAKGFQGDATTALGTLTAFGAAFAGIAAGFDLFRSGAGLMAEFVRSGVAYTAELETMKIGLASVVGSVEGMSFDKAQSATEGINDELIKMAAISPVGPRDLLEIFNGMYAPLRSAGLQVKEILKSTNDASAAFGALGIDIAQGARDISLIAGGRAGMQVKTFTKLQQAKAFGKDISAEEFNQMDASKRAKLLTDALKRVGGEAANAFAQSFTGLSSTLEGLYQEAQRAFLSPILDVVKNVMSRFADFYVAISEPVQSILRLLGGTIAEVLRPLFLSGLKWVERFAEASLLFMGAVNELGPGVAKLANAAGSLMSAGMAMGAAGTGAIAGAGVGGGLGAAIGTLIGLLTGTGPLATAIGSLAGAILGGAAGAAGGLLGAGTFEVIANNFEVIAAHAWAVYEAFGSSVFESFLQIWESIRTVLYGLGAVTLVVILQAFQNLSMVLAVVGEVVTDLLREFGLLGDGTATVDQAFQALLSAMKQSAEASRAFANSLLMVYAYLKETAKLAYGISTGDYVGAAKAGAKLIGGVDAPQIKAGGPMFATGALMGNSIQEGEQLKDRLKPVNNNTHIENLNMNIQQSFKDTNPDRLVRMMFKDLEQQAERVIASPFTGALAR